MCIDIVEIWFGIVNGQISAVFDSYLPAISKFSFPDDNFSKYQCIFTKLGLCIDTVKIWFGIADRQILLIFDRVTARDMSAFSFLDDNFSEYQ